MHRLLEQHGYVVACYPASISAAHEHRLHTVRSLLETDRITLIKSDLPPLGLAVLVRQLRQLSVCDFSPGVIASAARLLSHYIYAGAVLNSVTRLDRIPVGLTAHAKSWMPGSQFAVLANPDPQLVKVGPAAALTGPGLRLPPAGRPGHRQRRLGHRHPRPRLAGQGRAGDRACPPTRPPGGAPAN